MQQPPSDSSKKNPYAMPSAWPRAPEQTFHLRVPKAPPGTQAPAKPAPKPAAAAPRPARQSSILTGSALPVGYTAPQHTPETDFFTIEPVTPPTPAPQPAVEAAAPAPAAEPVEAAPEPEVTAAPPFIAPPRAPYAAAPRWKKKRQESGAPLFIAAGVAAVAGIAGAAWLLLRQPEATIEYAPVTTAAAPAPRQPVVTPPAFLGLSEEPVAEAPVTDEPALRGAAEPIQTAAVSRPAARAATTPSALPTGPQPYSGDAKPAPTVAVQPLRIPPPPAPPPPASAPGPQTPVADPDAPQTTRDPTSGD